MKESQLTEKWVCHSGGINESAIVGIFEKSRIVCLTVRMILIILDKGILKEVVYEVDFDTFKELVNKIYLIIN
jgi:hypothetical protein